MKILKEKAPMDKTKKLYKRVKKKVRKLIRNREFMLKFLTISMTLALLASSVLPYILR